MGPECGGFAAVREPGAYAPGWAAGGGDAGFTGAGHGAAGRAGGGHAGPGSAGPQTSSFSQHTGPHPGGQQQRGNWPVPRQPRPSTRMGMATRARITVLPMGNDKRRWAEAVVDGRILLSGIVIPTAKLE